MQIRKAGKRRVAPWLDADWRSWYQLERWRRIRREQLRREPLCAFCLKRGVVTVASIADHIVAHAGEWNSFITGDLQSLCPHCHDSTKRLDDNKQALDSDGWPVSREMS